MTTSYTTISYYITDELQQLLQLVFGHYYTKYTCIRSAVGHNGFSYGCRIIKKKKDKSLFKTVWNSDWASKLRCVINISARERGYHRYVLNIGTHKHVFIAAILLNLIKIFFFFLPKIQNLLLNELFTHAAWHNTRLYNNII